MPLTDQAVLDYIAAHPGAGREDVRRNVAPQVSSPTVWRALKRLVDDGRLEVFGKGRATGYSLAGSAVVRGTSANTVQPAATRRLQEGICRSLCPEQELLSWQGRPATPA